MAVPFTLICCPAAQAPGLLHSAPGCTVRLWLAKNPVQLPVCVSVFTAWTRSTAALKPVSEGLPEICVGTSENRKPACDRVNDGSSATLAEPVASLTTPLLTLKPNTSELAARLA